jgi:hypothetical protein
MTSSARAAILRDAAQGARLLRMTDYCAAALYEKRRGKLSVPRTLRGAISSFTRVFDALWLAAWCAAEPGSMLLGQRGSRLCAPKARITNGGRFHPESCRLIW